MLPHSGADACNALSSGRRHRSLISMVCGGSVQANPTPNIGADLGTIFNLLPVGVCLVDPDTSRIMLANDAAACILDVPAAQDLVGKSVLRLVWRSRRREVRDYFRHVMETAPLPRFFHEHLELAAGRLIDLEIAAGILNLESRPIIQLVFRDITDQISAETALRESEALFRSLAETTEAAIFLFRGSRNIHVNEAACRITGYDYNELVAMPFWQVVHPGFRDLVQERGMARQRGEAVVSNYEVAIRTKTGETRWLQYAGNVIDFQGQPAVLGTAIDITVRKEIEQALQESEARFRTLAQVSPASITVHVDDRVIYANPAAIELTGLSEEDLQAADFWSMLHPASLEAMQCAYERMGRGESVAGLKLQVSPRHGVTKWLEVNWSRFDQQGKTAWVITGYDITALVEAEQVLRNYARRLETLSQIDRLGLLVTSRQEIAGSVLELIRSLIPCDQANILETDPVQHSYVVLAASPQSDNGFRLSIRSAIWQAWSSEHPFRRNCAGWACARISPFRWLPSTGCWAC